MLRTYNLHYKKILHIDEEEFEFSSKKYHCTIIFRSNFLTQIRELLEVERNNNYDLCILPVTFYYLALGLKA